MSKHGDKKQQKQTMEDKEIEEVKGNVEETKENAEQNQAPKQEGTKETEEDAKNPVEELEKKFSDLNDKHLRLQAEFDNYRKRTAKEKMDIVVTANEKFIIGLLPVLDDCQRAIQAMDMTIAKADITEEMRSAQVSAKEGVELIFRKLLTYLESQGVKAIEAKGEALDTDKHNAIAQLPAPTPELKGKIIEIAKEGYTLNGKVIRFADVVVGI